MPVANDQVVAERIEVVDIALVLAAVDLGAHLLGEDFVAQLLAGFHVRVTDGELVNKPGRQVGLFTCVSLCNSHASPAVCSNGLCLVPFYCRFFNSS